MSIICVKSFLMRPLTNLREKKLPCLRYVIRHICSLVGQSPSFPSQFCSSWIKNSTQLQRIQYQYRRGWSQFKKTSTINCILTFWCATCPVLQPIKSPSFWGGRILLPYNIWTNTEKITGKKASESIREKTRIYWKATSMKLNLHLYSSTHETDRNDLLRY